MEAAIDPEPFSRFYMMLDGKRLPEDTYAENMLQRDIGISPELTAECLGIIKENGLYAGILEEVSGHLEVKLAEEPTPAETKAEDAPAAAPPAPAAEPRSRPKIFVGESRNSDAVDLVVHVLSEFGIPHEAATREPDDSSPISAGASELMRASTAAVLVIASGDLAEGGNGSGERALYQIGAASLLFGGCHRTPLRDRDPASTGHPAAAQGRLRRRQGARRRVRADQGAAQHRSHQGRLLRGSRGR